MYVSHTSCRAWHCYVDEDKMGEVKAIARKTHRLLMEFRIMGRMLIGLRESPSQT